MKNLKCLSYLFIAALCFGFVSCSDDDDDDNKKNVVVYDSISYDIHNGLLLYYGDEGTEGIYNFDLYLYTKGISLDQETGEIVGEGNILSVEFWSSSATGITPGVYTYDSESNEAGTFSVLCLEDAQGNVAYLESGTITVNKSASTYTIDITGRDADNKTLTANFIGTLEIY
ncbi:MAG: hypothetical protein LUH22_14105 [Bacteroides sp.]|nr:hypothetical protein [Bacteroides sp.]